MTTQHTAALVAAARAGDPRAQDELVGTFLPLVYNVVGRALNGSVDVDDVVQDTMLRALDGLGTLRSDESFRSWLVAIAMNRVRAHWQARHSAPGESGLEAAWELADPGADFVDLTVLRLQLEGQQRETARATRWLETDDRALLSLWWLECAGELTRAEVAAALELSPQHTAVRVQRMKAQLESARVVERALDAQPPCEGLRGVTGTWDGAPSTLWRKRIARHARECVRCAGLWSGLLPAEGLLAGLALVPVSMALLAGVRAATAGGIVPAGAAYAYDGGAGAQAGGPGGPGTGTGTGTGPGFDGTDFSGAGFDGTGFDGTDFSDAATQLTPTVSGQGGIPDAAPGGGRSVLRKRRQSRRRAVGGAVLAACVAGGGLAYLGGFPGSDDKETGAAPAAPSRHCRRPTARRPPRTPPRPPRPPPPRRRPPPPRARRPRARVRARRRPSPRRRRRVRPRRLRRPPRPGSRARSSRWSTPSARRPAAAP